jgi:MSHA biogenesis protein MshP
MLAVFMIVTLAAIGVYVLTISTGQVHATTQDEQAARAYQAARSGVDWAAYRLLQQNDTCASLNQTLTFAAPASWLIGFDAVVSCSTVGTETEGAITLTVYRISVTGCSPSPCTPATATTPGSATYVERQLQLTVTK